MVHGTKDWGSARSDIFILEDDLAELASRLFSINVYDRRGNVIYLDDFRHGLGCWQSTLSGTGAAVALSTTYPKWSPFCVKLTAGSTVGHYAKLSRWMDNWGANAFGLEVSAAWPTHFSSFYITIEHCDGDTIHMGSMELCDYESKMYILGTTGSYVELTDFTPPPLPDVPYSTMKLVVDTSTDEYVRFMLDGTSHGLSTYSLYTAGAATYRYLSVWVNLVGRQGQNDYCYVDGVIVTQGES